MKTFTRQKLQVCLKFTLNYRIFTFLMSSKRYILEMKSNLSCVITLTYTESL